MSHISSIGSSYNDTIISLRDVYNDEFLICSIQWMMMPTVYFHFGMPKTGSTYIQNTLLLNREHLLAQGFYYPTTAIERRGMSKYYEMTGQNLNFKAKASNELFATLHAFHHDFVSLFLQERKLIPGFIEECSSQHPQTNLIISCELLSIAPQKLMSIFESFASEKEFFEQRKQFLQDFFELFPNFDKKIIVYLRRQDLWLESVYLQSMKFPLFKMDPIQSYLKDYYPLDYAENLDQLSSLIGYENIIVRPYEKQQWYNENLVEDFFKALNICTTSIDPAPSTPFSQNETLAQEYVTYLQKQLPHRVENKAWADLVLSMRNFSYQKYETVKNEPISLFTPHEREQINDKYHEGNRYVAKKYLNMKDGILFREQFTTPEKNGYALNVEDLTHIQGGLFLMSQTLIRRNQTNLNSLKKDQQIFSQDLCAKQKSIKKLKTHIEMLQHDLESTTLSLHTKIDALTNELNSQNEKMIWLTISYRWMQAREQRGWLQKKYQDFCDYKLIKKSQRFDTEYLLTQVTKETVLNFNLIKFYLRQGISHALSPSREFNIREYMMSNQTLIDLGLNPFAHYLRTIKNSI